MATRARPDNLSLDHDETGLDFDELWDLRDDLRTACHRIVGEGGEADDVVQDTLLRALANAGRLDRRTSYAPWLATVARRRSIDEVRSRQRVRPVATPPEPVPTQHTDPLEHVLQQEAIERVRTALGALRPRERQLLLRQVTHGLSLAELAEEEATSIGSVRSVLARARTKLRTAVEKDGPLGVTPVPGVVAAVKRRLHRWVTRLDGRAPLIAGAGAQLGDMVVAVVAAAALLLAGTSPAPASGTRLDTTQDTPIATAPGSPGGDSIATAPRSATTSSTTTTTTTTNEPAPTLAPDWDAVPTLPNSDYDRPEHLLVATFATSADRRVVFASGRNKASEDAVLRSDDNGVTWERLPTPQAGDNRLLVPPTYPAEPTLFLVNAASLLRSDNHGRHFYPVAPAKGGVVAFAPDYAQSKRVLIAGTPLLEYKASGFPGTVRPLPAVPPSTDLAGIVAGWNHGTAGTVLVGGTSDRGSSRAATVYACTPTACVLHVTLPGAELAPRLFRSEAAPGAVFAWRPDRVLRSDDGGRTFASLHLPGVNITRILDGAPGELLLVGADVGAGAGVFRSIDGGRTWQPLGLGTPLASGARGIVRLASGRLVAGALTGAGLFCSDDNGRSWSAGCR